MCSSQPRGTSIKDIPFFLQIFGIPTYLSPILSHFDLHTLKGTSYLDSNITPYPPMLKNWYVPQFLHIFGGLSLHPYLKLLVIFFWKEIFAVNFEFWHFNLFALQFFMIETSDVPFHIKYLGTLSQIVPFWLNHPGTLNWDVLYGRSLMNLLLIKS